MLKDQKVRVFELLILTSLTSNIFFLLLKLISAMELSCVSALFLS